MAQESRGKMLVYVGTYNNGEGDGIYIYSLDASSGRLEPAGGVGGVKNPSFLDIHPTHRYLYSVAEVSDAGGTGAVHAFALDPSSGALKPLNHQSSRGQGPCHVSVDRIGKTVLVANYSSGSVAALPVRDDGSLGEATAFIQHEGSSVHARQKGPHAHSFTIDPSNRYAVAADLGLDKVFVYRLDPAGSKLVPNDPPWVAVQAGAGPRHFTFHPNRKYAYLINELDNTVNAFAYDEAKGVLREIHHLSTLPRGFAGTSYCADIHVAPSGKFLYGTNRGHDSLVIFEIDEATGRLTAVGWEPTQGNFPRNFALDPSGNFLFAANQNGNNLVAFGVDVGTGRLTPTGQVVEVPKPVCIRMIPAA